MKIYVVWGRRGEFKDTDEWIVCSYPFKEQAEIHCTRANQIVGEQIKRKPYWASEEEYNNPYDKTGVVSARIDYLVYTVEEIEFYEGLDAYIDAKQI